MNRNARTIMFVSLVVFGLTRAASAATITWSAPHAISGPSDVVNTGQLFDSIMFSSNNPNASTTVNGVTFDRAVFPGGAAPYGQNSAAGNIQTLEDNDQPTSAPTTGNAAYDKLLSTESYTNPGSQYNITLSGLHVGQNYLVQAWVDDQFSTNPSFAGQNSLSLNYGQANAIVVPNGDYIVGRFTADATTETLTWGGNSGGYAWSTIDALQVRTPEPSSMVLCGLGAVGLLVAARRRRKA